MEARWHSSLPVIRWIFCAADWAEPGREKKRERNENKSGVRELAVDWPAVEGYLNWLGMDWLLQRGTYPSAKLAHLLDICHPG